MSTGIIRTSGGYQSSASEISSTSSRPSGSAATTTSCGSSSTCSSANSHRNRNLLDSYHDFAMQIFGSNHSQEIEVQFLEAVQNGSVERVEDLLKRRSHEIFNIDVKDKETGNTPIIWAAKLSHLKITQLLLKFGADITLRNYDNETALDVARPNVLKPLLDSVSRVGCSPRHLLQAAWQGNLGTVKRLLSQSKILDINCRNVEGFTPLLLVTRDMAVFKKLENVLQDYNPLAVVSELLRHRADPVARDSEGKTALHYAAACNTKVAEEIAFVLIQEPALLEVRDNRSSAPIHSASQSGQIEVILALLDSGANVNARGFAGSTPLHVSACSGQYEVATTLLDHGADVTLVDDGGNTAVDVAKTKRLKSTLKEAWTEATQSKQEVVLGPVRVPSRMGDLTSSDERSPREGTSSDVSPREKSILRTFTDAHKAVLAEEQMLKDIESGKFTPGPNPRKPSYPQSSRNCNSPIKTPIPPRTPRVFERKKPPRSPEKTRTPKRSLSFCEKPKGDEARCQRVRGHAKLCYTRSDPTSRTGPSDVNQVPVTVVGLDLDESLRDIRLQRLTAGPVGAIMEKQHQNTQDRCTSRLSHTPSDNYQPPTSSALTNPSLTDVTDACNEYMKKGRKLGTRKASAGTEESDSVISWPRSKKKSPRKAHVLNLEQMHVRLSTPSPMSDCIRMFPNSRFVLPQSPAVSTGENLIGETIFEFENENDNIMNSTRSGSFLGYTRRTSSGSAGHFSNNPWRLPQSVQRTPTIVSVESNSPENSEEKTDEEKAQFEAASTFNIELSRVSPLKESSDSGQGSSRSTGSQGSSFSTDSTPSPSLHTERDSLVKVSVKNRMGIGMTPAATQVHENTRFCSRLRNPCTRTEEIRDLRHGLVKPALPTTIALSSVHRLGTIPVEKQPELQPLVAKRDVGGLDTINESTRTLSAESKTSESKPQNCRTPANAGSSIQMLSAEAGKQLSGEIVSPCCQPSVDANNTGREARESVKTKQSVHSDVKIESPRKGAHQSKSNESCAAEREPSSDSGKETAQKASDLKKAANERIVIKKLVTSKQNAESSKEQFMHSKPREAGSKTLSHVRKLDTTENLSLSGTMQGRNKISNQLTTGRVEDKTTNSSEQDTSKNIRVAKGASGSTSQEPATVDMSSTMNTKPSETVKEEESKQKETVCKPDSQRQKSAITSRECSSEIAVGNLTSNPNTKDLSQSKLSPRKVANCKPDVNNRPLGIPPNASQKVSPRTSKMNKPNVRLSPRPQQCTSNTPSQKSETAKIVNKVEARDQNKTSPRKMETAKSSLRDSAPGPNVSKGKPSLSKSFNSSDKSGIESELKRAKDEIGKNKQSDQNVSTKTTVDKTKVNSQLSKPQTSYKPPEVIKSPGNGENKTKNEISSKNTSGVNRKDGGLSKESSKPVKKPVAITSQSNKNVNNKNVKIESNSKKRSEDSKTSAKASTKNNQNQKENTTKKQKVNHVVNSKDKDSKSGLNMNDEENMEEGGYDSDVESMEDVEDMLESVTFVSDDEREFQNIVHIEIKTQEEMMADEPKEVEKKDPLPSKTKSQNKNQVKKDVKSKMATKGGGSGKGGKVTVVNGKPVPVKNTTQVLPKSNKPVSAKVTKKSNIKVQQNQASKSAGQKPSGSKSRSANLSGKHSLSMETLLETAPAKKTVVENTPVITDIMDIIKAVNKGVTPTPWRRSMSDEELSSPRKKNISPKRGGNVKTRTRMSNDKGSSGSKAKVQSAGKQTNQNKSVKKLPAGSATKSKDGFATNKNGKGAKISKGMLKDLHLLSESERQTTAFITGQGWQIKTDRNETEDVIINNPQDSSDSSDEEMQDADANLSPHHTINLQKMKIPSLNSEVIHNLANVMNPLECNTPRYLPDTMDTIKEFVDSLKSNESEDIALPKKLKESNNNDEENVILIAPAKNPPLLPPKQSLPDVTLENTHAKDADDNPPELPPKHSTSATVSNEHIVGSDDAPPPELPPKQSAVNVSETLTDMPPELPPKLSSSQKTSSDLDDLVKESPVVDEQRTDGDGAEDSSYSSYKTNPELLKVFHIPDHYEAPGGSLSPISKDKNAKEQQAVSDSRSKDGREESANPTILMKQNDQQTTSDVPKQQFHSERAKNDELTSKPPLPKSRSAKKSKVHLRRVNSEPTCLLDTSESDDDVDDFSHERKLNQEQNQKATIPGTERLRDIYSPRTARDVKKRTENTSLAKYIKEMQDSGQMKHETHKLEDLKELDEEDILHKEQLLNEHIQDMTMSALQEFNSLLSPVGEGMEVTSPIQLPSTAKGGEDLVGDAGDNEVFNRSLPMSEVSERSASMRTDDGDTLVSEIHSSGSITSRGFSGSSLMSSERSQSSNTTTSEPEGELLHWKKGNLLGRGAFGTVYCGLTSVGQLIAVKQVELSEKDKDKSRKQYETLQEEVQLLKTLRHRNIVGFLGCCLEGSTVNIFMQFIPGGSIASLLARFGALDEPVFCRYTKMILDGTEYLHANNVIHRDIKGANIMLMSNGVIKLIDFGCAKRLCINLSQSQNLLKSMRGTPYWMAPEVIMETGHGKKSDIWSIGCTVFEMATRKPPWAEMPPMPAIFAIGSGEQVPQLPEKFSPEARDFVNTCLTRDQNTRPSAKDLLSHSFIKNRRGRFSEQFRRISGASLEDSQITFKEQPTNRGDSTGSRSRRRESFK